MSVSKRATVADRDKDSEMKALTAILPTKSAKIRKLHSAGYSRSEIAKCLGIRYQHVRNVLVGDEQSGRATESSPANPSGATSEEASEIPVYGRCVVDEHGRVTLPAALVPLLDARSGTAVPWRYENGELKLMSREAGIRFAQSLVADLVERHPGNWSDDLIAQRRAEAKKETAGRRHG